MNDSPSTQGFKFKIEKTALVGTCKLTAKPQISPPTLLLQRPSSASSNKSTDAVASTISWFFVLLTRFRCNMLRPRMATFTILWDLSTRGSSSSAGHIVLLGRFGLVLLTSASPPNAT
eukprot:CAMPEP_0195022964 /NCGR_PEP_ID=MMETSP0326_2-20130528/41742_1 /TAXON_ID=2866 ORGANISM="Crypthecodinium cohnii, Strain Seligo" /NCGR_SAMPLE_ID=MMETSP0326_2 /ASSEMBLY_ACC=CAM_ASM_000348 /LENGTH=117 /DNA_ID=CAMNT_0040043027 /DNA_START=187 /DNA_END=540 /DNA_ORIENTATION=+